jgi:hypothetical protein
VQFSLVNDRALVAMHEFNGIFDGDDVIRLSFIDPVETRNYNPGIFTGTSCPLTSTCGKLPGEKIRSLTRVETWSISKSNAGVEMAGLDAALVLAARGLTSVSTVCSFSLQLTF